MENYRFSFQENQFFGACVPCTETVFNKAVDSQDVDWRISTRQAVEQAIATGQPLDEWAALDKFRKFCYNEEQKPRKGAAFKELPLADRLLQWTNSLKMNLPCFIFAVRDFELVGKTDKEGHPVMDAEGRQVMFQRRKQPNIQQLSGLFMFDADHLPIDPYEVYERTLRTGFPWQVRLAHKTSSGFGLRLVCEARVEVGNIADNQIELARELRLLGMLGTTGKPVTDDSCIDASRISYCPRRKDIYYIDNIHLFNTL